jgi:hypothetical protein
MNLKGLLFCSLFGLLQFVKSKSKRSHMRGPSTLHKERESKERKEGRERGKKEEKELKSRR